MISTTEIYFKNEPVYVLSTTAPSVDMTGEAIRNALRDELEFWRRHYPNVMEHVQVISGELTDLRSKYPFDNGGGQVVGNPPPQVRQMLGSVISAVEIARAVSKKDNVDVPPKPTARLTSVLRAVPVEEERPVKKFACDARTPIIIHLTMDNREI